MGYYAGSEDNKIKQTAFDYITQQKDIYIDDRSQGLLMNNSQTIDGIIDQRTCENVETYQNARDGLR